MRRLACRRAGGAGGRAASGWAQPAVPSVPTHACCIVRGCASKTVASRLGAAKLWLVGSSARPAVQAPTCLLEAGAVRPQMHAVAARKLLCSAPPPPATAPQHAGRRALLGAVDGKWDCSSLPGLRSHANTVSVYLVWAAPGTLAASGSNFGGALAGRRGGRRRPRWGKQAAVYKLLRSTCSETIEDSTLSVQRRAGHANTPLAAVNAHWRAVAPPHVPRRTAPCYHASRPSLAHNHAPFRPISHACLTGRVAGVRAVHCSAPTTFGARPFGTRP